MEKAARRPSPDEYSENHHIIGSDRFYPMTSLIGEAWASPSGLLPFDKVDLNALPD
jgi:hypothetical protein